MNAPQSPFLVCSESPTAFGMSLAAHGKAHPVYWDELWQSWVMLRRADIIAAFRDTETFSNKIYGIGPLVWSPVSKDGEEHTKRRRLFNRIFAPKAVEHYGELVIRPIARELARNIAARGSVDLIDDFAVKFPVQVFAGLLGLPTEFIDKTDGWVRAINRWLAMPSSPGVIPAAEQACREMSAHVRSAVVLEMNNPGPNLIGNMILAIREEGDVTLEECERIAILLIHGGYVTSTWTLAGVLSALLLHPDALRRVRGDRSMLPPLIEESMRWMSPMIGTFRLITRDVCVGGVQMRADDRVILCTAASNYDDDFYTRPDIFDIDRGAPHMLLGYGPHYCVGAPLGRLEGVIGMSALLDHLPDLRLDSREQPTFSWNTRDSLMHGPHALRVLC